MQGGKSAYPHFHVGFRRADAAFLRSIGVIGQKFGLDLQPGDDVRPQFGRKHGHRRQHAVKPVFQFQSLRSRLQMQIAGPACPPLGKNGIDYLRGILRIGRIKFLKSNIFNSQSSHIYVIIECRCLLKPSVHPKSCTPGELAPRSLQVKTPQTPISAQTKATGKTARPKTP